MKLKKEQSQETAKKTRTAKKNQNSSPSPGSTQTLYSITCSWGDPSNQYVGLCVDLEQHKSVQRPQASSIRHV